MEIPLRAALGQFSLALPADFADGYDAATCPVCGSRPGMATLLGEEGRRLLVCSSCSYSWQFRRLACPYCDCDDPDKLSYFSAGDGPVRVDICCNCSRFIKTLDSRRGWSDAPIEGVDLMTVHLDLLAAREGYERGK